VIRYPVVNTELKTKHSEIISADLNIFAEVIGVGEGVNGTVKIEAEGLFTHCY
jgi:hypothetical protein